MPHDKRKAATRFVVVAGPPCAGKSTVARRIAPLLDAPHLQMDEFRARLLADSDQRVEHRDIAYRAMHFTAELLASRCGIIVLDATYTARICRSDLLRVIERVDGVLSVVECRVSAAGAEERFRGRGTHPARDLTPERVRTLATSYPYSGRPDVIVTSAGDGAVDDLVRVALDERLNDSNGPAWCESGLPRDPTVRAMGSPAAGQRFAPAPGTRSWCGSVQPRT